MLPVLLAHHFLLHGLELLLESMHLVLLLVDQLGLSSNHLLLPLLEVSLMLFLLKFGSFELNLVGV